MKILQGSLSLLFLGAAVLADTSSCPGYKLLNAQDSSTGFTADLKLAGKPCNAFGNDIEDLTLQVSYDTENRMHVNIQDKDGKQYQIPESIMALDPSHKVGTDGHMSFEYIEDPKYGFGFKVARDGKTIFDTTGHPLVFEDQYIEVTSNLPKNANIYGIGETPDFFRRDPNNTTMTLWNRDAADPFRENVYGAHTIHMELRDGKFHGAYLHNSHGMDIVLANQTIQYRAIGGTADFYFFGGPTALNVIDQYTELVGRPNRIPYWSLGYQNCRYGYESVYEVNDVIANYSKAGIPLEVAWTDIDYMNHTRDFTFDPVNFPVEEMRKQLEYLEAHNQKMVLMVDPAIWRHDEYGTYVRGHEKDIFIKNADGTEFIGQVWPGYTAFPDWFHPDVDEWWHNEWKMWADQIPAHGFWIDMNEAASFCTGSCGTGRPQDEIPPQPWTVDPQPEFRKLNTSDKFLVPPYAIHNPWVEISNKTIETTAVHANGLIDYHVHNIYGLMESITTYDFLKNYRPDVRPFLLSRSTFAGSGAYVNHWTGDNDANWLDLHVSIASMLDFGIFGIPMVGADICGFNSNTTEQLCARWSELGAFYPFSRNHNAIDQAPQENYRWDTVAEATRRALAIRYAMLPYYYTNYQHATEKGWPVARALIWEFPENEELADNDRQFLIGDGLLISPVIVENATTVDAYFPEGTWYDWHTLKPLQGANANVTLEAPLEHVNVHLRGGRIYPGFMPGMTITDMRNDDFQLFVATEDGKATGELYEDDGETFSSPHRWVDFEYANNQLAIKSRDGSFNVQKPLTKITLLGVDNVKSVLVNGATAADAKITSNNGSTVVEGLDIDMNQKTNIVTFV